MAFVSHKAEVLAAVDEAIRTGMDAVGQHCVAKAVDEITKLVYDTPPSPTYVRTGNLRNSITYAFEIGGKGKTVIVGTPVEYAPYVEYGTRKMVARPFLKNAGNYSEEYKAILQSILMLLS